MMKATVLFGLVCCCVFVSVLSAPATDSPQPAVMECVCVVASSCDIPQDKTQADNIQKETVTRCAKSEPTAGSHQTTRKIVFVYRNTDVEETVLSVIANVKNMDKFAVRKAHYLAEKHEDQQHMHSYRATKHSFSTTTCLNMKFVLALIAAVVVLAAVCQEGDASIIINGPQERDFVYPPPSTCTCENCACKSRFICANENIVPYRYCPGSYIYVCCKTGSSDQVYKIARELADSRKQAKVYQCSTTILPLNTIFQNETRHYFVYRGPAVGHGCHGVLSCASWDLARFHYCSNPLMISSYSLQELFSWFHILTRDETRRYFICCGSAVGRNGYGDVDHSSHVLPGIWQNSITVPVHSHVYRLILLLRTYSRQIKMKFTIVLLVFMATLIFNGEANPYVCDCPGCECVRFDRCKSENVVPYKSCPQNYIKVCCKPDSWEDHHVLTNEVHST
ncbi:hypothetical protein CBL_12446 [Carabus blaptoides fortunei]